MAAACSRNRISRRAPQVATGRHPLGMTCKTGASVDVDRIGLGRGQYARRAFLQCLRPDVGSRTCERIRSRQVGDRSTRRWGGAAGRRPPPRHAPQSSGRLARRSRPSRRHRAARASREDERSHQAAAVGRQEAEHALTARPNRRPRRTRRLSGSTGGGGLTQPAPQNRRRSGPPRGAAPASGPARRRPSTSTARPTRPKLQRPRVHRSRAWYDDSRVVRPPSVPQYSMTVPGLRPYRPAMRDEQDARSGCR